MTRDKKMAVLQDAFGEKTGRILEQFGKLYPEKDILYALSVDTMFRPGTVSFLDARTAWLEKEGCSTPCWNYLMSFIIPYLGGTTPFHCADISYVFRHVDSEPLLCTGYEYAEKLQSEVSEALLSFMKKDDPSTPEHAFFYRLLKVEPLMALRQAENTADQ
mgnify:CR=1 FL=1